MHGCVKTQKTACYFIGSQLIAAIWMLYTTYTDKYLEDGAYYKLKYSQAKYICHTNT
jgi:hypothetical protein